MRRTLLFAVILALPAALLMEPSIAETPSDNKYFQLVDNTKAYANDKKVIQYADLTVSPPGFPLDDRLELDSSNPTVFSTHYLSSMEQFKSINDNLAYLNCGDKFKPTSAFYFDVESYVNGSEFETYLRNHGHLMSRKSEFTKVCSGYVLVSVAHYFGNKPLNNCEVISSMDADANALSIRPESIVRGEISTISEKVTNTTPGTDFAIMMTSKETYDYSWRPSKTVVGKKGFPLCSSNEIVCKRTQKLTLGHLKYDRQAEKTEIPKKAITAQCNIVGTRDLSSVNSERVKHSCSALHGSSGGPILNISCDKVCAVGLQNVALNPGDEYNREFNHGLSLKSKYFKQKMNEFVTSNCSY